MMVRASVQLLGKQVRDEVKTKTADRRIEGRRGATVPYAVVRLRDHLGQHRRGDGQGGGQGRATVTATATATPAATAAILLCLVFLLCHFHVSHTASEVKSESESPSWS